MHVRARWVKEALTEMVAAQRVATHAQLTLAPAFLARAASRAPSASAAAAMTLAPLVSPVGGAAVQRTGGGRTDWANAGAGLDGLDGEARTGTGTGTGTRTRLQRSRSDSLLGGGSISSTDITAAAAAKAAAKAAGRRRGVGAVAATLKMSWRLGLRELWSRGGSPLLDDHEQWRVEVEARRRWHRDPLPRCPT